MNSEDEKMILDVVRETWLVQFNLPDGDFQQDLCESYQELPDIVEHIRSQGGQNIVITDKTIFWTDAKGH